MLYNLLAAAGSNTLCSHIPIKQAVADLLKARIHQNKWLRHHYSTIYNPLMGLRVGAMQYILQSASILLEGAISLEWELPFSGKKIQSCMVRKWAGVLACEGIRATCDLQKTMGTMTRLRQSLKAHRTRYRWLCYPVPQFLSVVSETSRPPPLLPPK